MIGCVVKSRLTDLFVTNWSRSHKLWLIKVPHERVLWESHENGSIVIGIAPCTHSSGVFLVEDSVVTIHFIVNVDLGVAALGLVATLRVLFEVKKGLIGLRYVGVILIQVSRVLGAPGPILDNR